MSGFQSQRSIREILRDGVRAEEGSITVLSLFLFTAMLFAAGFAIDVNSAQQARVKLQGAADAAGHAALVWRHKTKSEALAVAKAIEVAEANMPTAAFGNVLTAVDVEFGDWDSISRTFTPDPSEDKAVRVTTRRNAGRNNSLGTFLLGFVGIQDLNMTTTSVWDAEDGWCPPQTDADGDNEKDADGQHGEGFFALGIVDIQSNNAYKDGFCIHSETHVEFNQNSTFDDNVTVSMPNEEDIKLPSSGFDKNSGLEAALDSINYNLAVFFNSFPDTVASYFDETSAVQPEYMEDTTQVYDLHLNGGDKLTMDMLEPNAVNEISCAGDKMSIEKNETIHDVVIVTDCEVTFLEGSAIENATLVTTATSAKSVFAPNGFRVGAKDYCTDGEGGASILTLGGLRTASEMEAFGANVIAMGDISITAGADGLAGINFMSAGRIDATSNGDMGFCRYGPPDLFQIPVFRMVM